MVVVPREAEKLNLNNAEFLAQKRLARGLRLNHPKAAALIATQTGNKFFLVFNIFWIRCSSKGGTVGDIGGAYQRRCISAGMRGGSVGGNLGRARSAEMLMDPRPQAAVHALVSACWAEASLM